MIIKVRSTASVAFIAFSAAIIVFFLRYPQPIITPTIYAEDAVWVGSALTNGWVHTFIHARPDYFVFFNIFFLFIASNLSKLFSGSELLLLPFFIASLSYAFYAISATVISLTVRRYTGNVMAIIAFFMSIMIPLGMSQAESIGTLVQIGFYMPILSICVHLYRDKNESVALRLTSDLLIVLMAATNPVNFIITGIYTVIKLFTSDSKTRFLAGLAPLLVTLLFLFIIIVPRMNGTGGIIGAYNGKHLIEMVTARSILFPFVFSFYNKLNDLIAVIFTILYFAFVIFSYIKVDKAIRIPILLLAITLIVYTAATAAGRSGITGILTGYDVTYPDRYFMGINIISTILMAICVGQINNGMYRYLYGLAIIIIYAFGMSKAFETAQEKRNIPLEYIHTNALCNAKSEGNGFSRIQALPSRDWYIRVPSSYVDSIICKKY